MRHAYDGRVTSRVDQLLGVVALAATDRLRDGFGNDRAPREAVAETEAAALVHLQAWPRTSVNELAGVIGRSQPATVRVVDRLVARGWVRRRAGDDRRTLALGLTDAGERRATDLLNARSAALAPLFAELSSTERAQLERLLDRVAARLADDRPAARRACRLCDRGACMSGPGCPMQHTMAPGAARPHVPDRRLR
jgi:DNA-binding MarR family transcriptional regulator